jgi:putative MATE family efflux protein
LRQFIKNGVTSIQNISTGSKDKKKARAGDLTSGNEAKLLFYFALPMLIGNVFQQLYSTVDSIIVGRALGKNALAAVGISFPVIFLLISLILGVTMGTTILIAQYYGARDMQNVKKTMDNAYIFLFFASLAITVVGLIVSKPVLILLKTPPEVLPMAKEYMDITFIGIITAFGYNSINAILRGLGDSKTPLLFLIIATIINIILDLIFILVFGWGVAGAAWATVIAQGCSFAFGLYYLNRFHEVFNFNFREMRFDREIFRLTIKIGLPTGIQQMLVGSGMTVLFRIVNSFGSSVVAAYTAATRIDSFASMPAMNFSAAVSSFVGQNLGAGKPERVKKGFLAALGMSSVISLAMTAITIIFGGKLVSLFNTDPEVIATGARYLMIVGLFYIVFTAMFITNGVMRGAGDTFIPMLITLISLWLARVPASAFLSQKHGSDGIWWGIPLGWLVGTALSAGYYLTGRWKTKVVTGEKETVQDKDDDGTGQNSNLGRDEKPGETETEAKTENEAKHEETFRNNGENWHTEQNKIAGSTGVSIGTAGKKHNKVENRGNT